MQRYYRQTNSIYATFRYANQNTTDFIAPQGKVANFIFDQAADLIPHAMQYGGDVLQNLQQHGGHALQQAQDYGSYLANKTGLVEGLQNARAAAQPMLDQAGQAAQQAGKYIQGHPGQDAAAAAGAGGVAAAGAGLVRKLKSRGRQAVQAVQQGAQDAGQAMGGGNNLRNAGLAAAGLAGVGGLGYAANQAMQPQDANYSSNLVRRNARFSRRAK